MDLYSRLRPTPSKGRSLRYVLCYEANRAESMAVGDFLTLWRSCIGPPQPPYPASRDFPLFRGQNKASLRLPAVSYATPLTSTHSVFYIAGNAAYRRSHQHGVSYLPCPPEHPRATLWPSPPQGQCHLVKKKSESTCHFDVCFFLAYFFSC